ncbi:MAG: hypothetical protein ABH986_05300 [archaeon]
MAVPKPRGKIARGLRALRLKKLTRLRQSQKRKKTLGQMRTVSNVLAEMRGPGRPTSHRFKLFIDGYTKTLENSVNSKRKKLKRQRKGVF